MPLGRESGMTLVELSVALTIIGVLAFVSYPLITNALYVLNSKGAAEEVAGAVRQARQYAITNGQNYCFSIAGDSYSIGPATDATFTTNACTISPTTLTGEIGKSAFGSPTASVTAATKIIFDPIGNVKNQGVTTPYVVQIGVDTQPTSCLSTVGVTLYGGVRAIKC
jgi:prepilin-type N-terminal cleavage/methylation domain-containing protein